MMQGRGVDALRDSGQGKKREKVAKSVPRERGGGGARWL